MNFNRLASAIRLTTTMAVVLAGSAALAGQAVQAPGSGPRIGPKPEARKWSPPRTPWGDPDLQGAYTNKDENGIPMERPAQFQGKTADQVQQSELAEIVRKRQQDATELAPVIGGAETGAGPVHWYEYYGAKNSRPWLIVDPADGRIPSLTPEAQQRAAALRTAREGRGESDGPEDRSLYDRCVTRGVPGSMMPVIYGNSYQIVQGPGMVAIRYEMIHETRVIPLDGRPHVDQSIRLYMGDPRGHWEGNTLVVETTNFNGRMAADIVGYGSPDRGASQQLRIVERFTPSGPTSVEWSVRLDDPHTWARPWTFTMTLTKDDTQSVYEYACHEGNYGLSNILSAARVEERGGSR